MYRECPGIEISFSMDCESPFLIFCFLSFVFLNLGQRRAPFGKPWEQPNNGAFLLTVDNFSFRLLLELLSFFTYNFSFFYLQLELFCFQWGNQGRTNLAFSKPCLCLSDTRHFCQFSSFLGGLRSEALVFTFFPFLVTFLPSKEIGP